MVMVRGVIAVPEDDGGEDDGTVTMESNLSSGSEKLSAQEMSTQMQSSRRKVRDAVAAEILAEYTKKPAQSVRIKPKRAYCFASHRRYFGCCYTKNIFEAVVDADCQSVVRQLSRAQRIDKSRIRKLGGVERTEAFNEDETNGFVGEATKRANAYDDRGRTPLSLAIKVVRADIADHLLNMQANPNKVDDWPNHPDQLTGASPLLSAVLADLPGTAVELARYNADVNIADRYGLTPLMLACLLGDQELCDMLLENQAEPDARDNAGWTPLIYAAYAGHLGCVKRLLEAGANPRMKDKRGHSARDWAFYMRIQSRRATDAQKPPVEANQHGRCESYLEKYKPKLALSTQSSFDSM